MEPAHGHRSVRWGSVVLAVVLMALSAAYLVWRAVTPAECALLFPDPDQWSADGVRPEIDSGCRLPAQALVTAVQSSTPDAVAFTVGPVGRPVILPLGPPALLDRLGPAWSTLVFCLALVALAWFAFARRPADRAAGALLVLSTGLLGSTVVTLVGLPARFGLDGMARWLFLGNVVLSYLLAWGALLILCLLFPSPLLSGATRFPVRAAVLISPTVLCLAGATLAAATAGRPSALAWIAAALLFDAVLPVVTLVIALLILGLHWFRVRHDPARTIERQQLLWFGGSGAAAALVTLALWMVPQLLTGAPVLSPSAIGAPGLLLVVGLTVALLRYRMFDLDVVLVRTMVYATLTLLVVLIYLAVAGLLGATFGGGSTTAPTVAGALAVAIVVNPLRLGLLRAVNLLVYGHRDSPYVALSRVAEQLTATTHRRLALPAVAAEVGRALRVPYVAIEWWSGSGVRVVESGRRPAEDSALHDVSLIFGGEPVGRLRTALRGRGERFAPAERRLLSDLSRQVGSAVHEVQLADELQHSRERLVLAREEERRMIRRTLHDEIGPTVAGIALRADTVRRLTEHNRNRANLNAAVDGITRDAAAAARSLRLLSYDLRPPSLDDRGLLLALRDQGAQLAPMEVLVEETDESDATSALPAAVEVAVYRIAVGAMANSALHGTAMHCWVRLDRDGSELSIQIDDDGTGLPADFRIGVGIAAMRERARELGGTCWHEPRGDGGTRVRANLPIAAPT